MEFKEAYSSLLSNFKVRRKGWPQSIYLKMGLQDHENRIKCYIQECVTYVYDSSIITSNGWIILDCVDADGLLTFPDMCQKLFEGYKAKLLDWPPDCFIESTPNRKEIFLRRICEYDFTPTFECFSSSDWEIIEEKTK